MPLEALALSMRPQTLFESWDCTPPALPPRSRLYGLDPVGIGTPFVESLSGYVARLADAHAVSVGDMVGRELVAFASKPLISFGRFMKQNRATSHGFHAQAQAINGLGESSRTWTEALEKATQRTMLRFLTMSAFNGVLSRQSVLRSVRAWCPRCYEDWRSMSNVIYEPLVWSIGHVTLCPHHLQPLVETCRLCCRQSAPLAVYSRPGYCSHCQEWLGDSERQDPPVVGQETYIEVWRAKEIGELLACAPKLDSLPLGDVFSCNLRACVDAVARGNSSSFAKTCQVSSSAFRSHLLGNNLPTMDVLLRLCRRLDIPFTAFFETDQALASAYWKHAAQTVQHEQLAPAYRPAEQLRLLLHEAVQEQPAPSLSEIAARLGYKGTERLYQVDSVLCQQISLNYRRSGRSHRWKKPGARKISEEFDLRRLLEESLAKDEPVSCLKIAAQLGYTNEGYLRKQFPDLCRAIAKKIAVKRSERTSTIERILRDALEEKAAPTLDEIRKRVSYSSSVCLQFSFPVLCRQILRKREAHHEKRIAQLRVTLEHLQTETPAPSLRTVSTRTGISPSHLKTLCPEQCAVLASRHLSCRHETAALRRTQLIEEVQKIVHDLHCQGKCPTVGRVSALLQPNSLREWKTLTEAVKMARNRIGLQICWLY
jgi:AraC-like DNA-binding protein